MYITSCLCVQNHKLIMYLCMLVLLSNDDCEDKKRLPQLSGIDLQRHLFERNSTTMYGELGMFYAHPWYTYYYGLL